MNIIESSENLSFVYKTLKDLKFDGGKRLEPSKENALELLILHDLMNLVELAKEGNSFNTELLREILEKDFVRKIKTGKSAKYYNFKKTLENPEYLEHLKVMLNSN